MKRLLSIVLAVSLCQSMLVTAWAAEPMVSEESVISPVPAASAEADGTEDPVSEDDAAFTEDPAPEEDDLDGEPVPGEDAVPDGESQPEETDPADEPVLDEDPAVAAVRELIDALPTVDALQAMDKPAQGEVYLQTQAAYEEYKKLTEDQQALLDADGVFEELFGFFNKQIAPLTLTDETPETSTATQIKLSGDISEQEDAWGRSSGEYYVTLEEDVTLQGIQLEVLQGQTVTLDLNGHTLRASGSNPRPIRICDGGELTLKDSSEEKTGTGTGTVTGGRADQGGGGGVDVRNRGTFIMKGGIITDNATTDGKNNKYSGGGVYVYSGGVFEMTGGTITGNTANSGKGDNVYVEKGATFKISGSAIIADEEKSNVYLSETAKDKTEEVTAGLKDAIITVVGKLDGAKIGVTREAGEGVFTWGYTSNNSIEDYDKFFTSDSDDYYCVQSDDKTEVALKKKPKLDRIEAKAKDAKSYIATAFETEIRKDDIVVTAYYTGNNIKPKVLGSEEYEITAGPFAKGETYFVVDENKSYSVTLSYTEGGETVECTFDNITVKPKDFSDDTVTVGGITDQEYTGKPITQDVSVTDNARKETLGLDVDYTLAYDKNTNAGTATVTITGKGNYKGTIKTSFTVGPKSIEDAPVILDPSEVQPYTSKNKPKPQVTVQFGDEDKPLVKGTDYKVEYAYDVKEGIATVTITGIGNYTGKVEKKFAILEPTLTVSSEDDSDVSADLTIPNVFDELTGEEKGQLSNVDVDNRAKLSYKLTVKDVPAEDEESEEDAGPKTPQQLIKAKAGDYQVGQYLKIELSKTLDGDKWEDIPATSRNVTLKLNIPKKLLGGTNRSFAVLCTYEDADGKNVTDRLTDKDADRATITISAKHFSDATYAIVYKDLPVKQTSSGSSGSGSDGSYRSGFKPAAAPATVPEQTVQAPAFIPAAPAFTAPEIAAAPENTPSGEVMLPAEDELMVIDDADVPLAFGADIQPDSGRRPFPWWIIVVMLIATAATIEVLRSKEEGSAVED